jgi:predicted protein tyrosine phosphatase
MGLNRSPTAARVAKDIVSERSLDIEMIYGGIDYIINDMNTNMHLALQIEELRAHFNEFDRIFVMEKYMQEGLEKILKVSPQKIICMNIPDKYRRDDHVLVGILKNSLGILI